MRVDERCGWFKANRNAQNRSATAASPEGAELGKLNGSFRSFLCGYHGGWTWNSFRLRRIPRHPARVWQPTQQGIPCARPQPKPRWWRLRLCVRHGISSFFDGKQASLVVPRHPHGMFAGNRSFGVHDQGRQILFGIHADRLLFNKSQIQRGDRVGLR